MNLVFFALSKSLLFDYRRYHDAGLSDRLIELTISEVIEDEGVKGYGRRVNACLFEVWGIGAEWSDQELESIAKKVIRSLEIALILFTRSK